MQKTFKETSIQRLFLGLDFPGGRREHAGEVVRNVNGWSFIPGAPVGPGYPGSSHPRNPCFPWLHWVDGERLAQRSQLSALTHRKVHTEVQSCNSGLESRTFIYKSKALLRENTKALGIREATAPRMEVF